MTRYPRAVWLTLCLGVLVPDVVRTQTGAGACARRELRFDMALDKASYQVGEPIVVNIRIHNVGSEPVEMSRTNEVTGRVDGFTFVRVESGLVRNSADVVNAAREPGDTTRARRR